MLPERIFALAAKAACVAGLVSVLATTSARAQGMPFLGSHELFLTASDFDLADAAARKLLTPQPSAMGTTANWDNPASGNSGTLTMGRAYQKDGHDCRAVSWRDVFKSGAERTVQLGTCNIAGVWKLM